MIKMLTSWLPSFSSHEKPSPPPKQQSGDLLRGREITPLDNEKDETNPSLVAQVVNPFESIKSAPPITSKEVKGPGFPLVSDQVRDRARAATVNAMKAHLKNGCIKEGDEFFPLLQHVKFYRGPAYSPPIPQEAAAAAAHEQDESEEEQDLIPQGMTIQTPIRMDYDEKFEEKKGRNAFLMHSTPAPDPRWIDISKEKNKSTYLHTMEKIAYGAFQAQIASGAKKIIWNYFGMGAFLRNMEGDYILPEKKMGKLRNEIAERLVNAFTRVMREAVDNQGIELFLAGPTGESFEEHLKQEPGDNYAAFVKAFEHCPFASHVTLCPETDAFIKGQELADGYEILSPGKVAPVSVINAADPALLGNHWFEGFKSKGRYNARFAIDENGHRRSELMAAMSSHVNTKLSKGLPITNP